MRICLHARSLLPHSPRNSVPVVVTIKPFNHVGGVFEYRTESAALLRLLRLKTDLAGYTLDRFLTELSTCKESRLASILVKEEVLQEIGYFID